MDFELKDIEKARTTDKLIFKCENCGKDVKLEKRYFTKALCKKCKVKDTLNERYGVSNVFNLASSRENLKKSVTSKEANKKRKQTCLAKYGTEFQIASKSTREKTHSTVKEKYGVDYNFQSSEVKEKIKQVKIERYGSENPNIKWLYEYKGEKFDSSWELAYWIYCEDNSIPIERNHTPFQISENSNCYPDFLVDNHQLVEIKSSYLKSKPDYYLKEKCYNENNIIVISDKEIEFYLAYIYSKYGKDYIKTFKTKLSKLK